MRIHNVLLILAVCVTLTACASRSGEDFPPIAVDTSGITVSGSYGVPADARILGYVEGVSCAHSLLPNAATKAAAIADLKREAARLGATGVAHLRNHTRGFTSSCVYSQVAEGLAYRMQ